MAPSEPTHLEGATARQLAMLRAIAAHPGCGPEALRDALDDLTGHRWSMATLYKDVAALKAQGLLEPGRNRHGYFLAGAGFTPDELQMLLNGLRIQAQDLGNPHACALYEKLLARVVSNGHDEAAFKLPLAAIANRPVVRTANNGFADVMTYLREPLLEGRPVALELCRTPWAKKPGRPRFEVYPLQFLFHDVAWYLLAERVDTRTFMVLRVDRIHPAIQPLDAGVRGPEVQATRQALGRAVLRQGWGMAMPRHTPEGALSRPLTSFKLRFSPRVAPFIAEGVLRHEVQRFRSLADGDMSFSVGLPPDPAVVFQFRRWVLTWGQSVEVVGPAWFRKRVSREQARSAVTNARPGAVTFAPPAAPPEQLPPEQLAALPPDALAEVAPAPAPDSSERGPRKPAGRRRSRPEVE